MESYRIEMILNEKILCCDVVAVVVVTLLKWHFVWCLKSRVKSLMYFFSKKTKFKFFLLNKKISHLKKRLVKKVIILLLLFCYYFYFYFFLFIKMLLKSLWVIWMIDLSIWFFLIIIYISFLFLWFLLIHS